MDTNDENTSPRNVALTEGLGPADAYGPTPDFSERTVPYYKAETVQALLRGRWQSMNTAPRDCKPMLLFDGSKNGGVFVGHEATFPTRRWLTARAFPIQPSHWMPLPAGPNDWVVRLATGAKEMLTDQQLQTLRNLGNEAEDAADEIERMRAENERIRSVGLAMCDRVIEQDGGVLGVSEVALLDLIDSLRAGYVVPGEDGGDPVARTEKEAVAADMLEALHRGLKRLHSEFRLLYDNDSSAGYKKWDAARMKVDCVLTQDSWGERDLVYGGTHGS